MNKERKKIFLNYKSYSHKYMYHNQNLLVNILCQTDIGDTGYNEWMDVEKKYRKLEIRNNNKLSEAKKKYWPASSPNRWTDGFNIVELIDLQFFPNTVVIWDQQFLKEKKTTEKNVTGISY